MTSRRNKHNFFGMPTSTTGTFKILLMLCLYTYSRYSPNCAGIYCQISEEEEEEKKKWGEKYSEDFSVSEDIEEDLDSFLNSSQSGKGPNCF